MQRLNSVNLDLAIFFFCVCAGVFILNCREWVYVIYNIGGAGREVCLLILVEDRL